MRELLQRFDGQEIKGELLGLDGPFQLPTFSQVLPYLSPDGQVEVDALAEGSQRWVVEIKWRNKRVGLKELHVLAQKAHNLNGRPWYISQGGFTPKAETFASENQILFSNRSQIEALGKAIRG